MSLPAATRFRRPIVPAAICFALGILLDHAVGLPWMVWLILGAGLVVAWAIVRSFGRARTAGMMLLLACLAAGGLRHHAASSVGTADAISLFATDERTPVRLAGVIATAPWVRPPVRGPLQSAWPQLDTTVCDVECRRLHDGDEAVTVSGRVRLRVTGHMLHAEAGDLVEIRGWMARPQPPANPGEFDYRAYLERQGVRCVVSADHPDALTRIGRESGWWFTREVGRVRAAIAQRFVEQMHSRTAPVASALLLEDRARIDEELETAFAETGMMHVLAISGLHVAILAALCMCLCRIARLPPTATAVMVLLAVAAQAVIAEARPPILRAGVFIAILLVGRTCYRQAPLGNTLAAALLLVLLWDPTDLFDIGLQLSFLAVMGMAWWQTTRGEWRDAAGTPDPLAQLAAGPIRRGWWWLRGRIGESVGMMFGIWLFAAPLIAAQFHLVSPVGILLNVVLIAPVALVLWCGYLSLFFALVLPPLAGLFSAVFDYGLLAFLFAVEAAARYDLGHLYVPGPPVWWLAGYYVVLIAIIALRETGWRRAKVWQALAAWGVLGLAAALVPSPSPELRCTFLAVGHGNAILLELPNGRTLLYDAGAIDDAERAKRTVLYALWERGLSRIDAMVLSHPDLDHFNGAPGVLQSVPVGTLLCARPFVSVEQANTVPVVETAAANGVPIRLIGRDDLLRLDDDVSIRVLHPHFARRSAEDNADSIVLQIDYAGRRILLTGDLESDGMDALLALPPRDVDVLLSPHHGSAAPNTSGLAEWARPAHVVVSGGREQVIPVLRRAYGDEAAVWNTSECGAVSATVDGDGRLSVIGFRAASEP